MAKSTVAKSTIGKSAVGRVQVLRTLDAFGALDEAMIRSALRDSEAGVREQAIQLAESRAANSPELFTDLLAMANDANARVRFQCALTIGESNDPRNLAALAKIARHDSGDKWASAAVLSSLAAKSAASRLEPFLKELIRIGSRKDRRMISFFQELGRIRGTGPAPGLFTELRLILDPNLDLPFPQQAALVSGFAEGLRTAHQSKEPLSMFNSLFYFSSNSEQPERKQFDALCRQAVATASSRATPLDERVVSIRLLSEAEFATAGRSLLGLLNPSEPDAVQSAAVRSLSLMSGKESVAEILSGNRWKNFTPSLRAIVLGAILAQPRHFPALLDALEAGGVPKSALTSAQRNQLLKLKDTALRQRAEGLFKNAAVGDRQKAFEASKSVLQLKANPANGKTVFKQLCASCHRLDREGVAVGPDLFEIRNQPKEAILLHIIIPEYEIVPGYASYDVETKDGRTLSGLIASETAASVTLRRAQGEEETILRGNIASISSSGLSLMPQELEKNISRQELADLLAYLKGESVTGELPVPIGPAHSR